MRSLLSTPARRASERRWGRHVKLAGPIAAVMLCAAGLFQPLSGTPVIAHAGLTATSSRIYRELTILRSESKPLAVVFGDSLITQAETLLASDLRNVKIDQYSRPGVAACHYLESVKQFLKTHKPHLAVIEFWGNDTPDTPCVNKHSFESAGFFAQYKANVSTMVREFVMSGAHVFLVGTIPDAAQVATTDPRWGELNEIYSAIARSYSKKNVSFVNVQQVVEQKGDFTWYLPCLHAEASCDAPLSDVVALPPKGNNIVRSADGLHFCPLYPTTSNALFNFTHCATYSSGTYRYAMFLATAVENYLSKGFAPKFIGDPLPPFNTPEPGIAGQIDPYTGKVYPDK